MRAAGSRIGGVPRRILRAELRPERLAADADAQAIDARPVQVRRLIVQVVRYDGGEREPVIGRGVLARGVEDEAVAVYNPEYLDIQRTDDIVLVQITLSAGRSMAKKQAFYARLAALLQVDPGVRPEDVTVSLVENTREDWSFGNGEASYVVLPREQCR